MRARNRSATTTSAAVPRVPEPAPARRGPCVHQHQQLDPLTEVGELAGDLMGQVPADRPPDQPVGSRQLPTADRVNVTPRDLGHVVGHITGKQFGELQSHDPMSRRRSQRAERCRHAAHAVHRPQERQSGIVVGTVEVDDALLVGTDARHCGGHPRGVGRATRSARSGRSPV